MPQLPNTDARRRAPQSQRGVIGDPTAGMVAETVSTAAGQAQGVVNQIQQQQDDLAFAQAKADMVVADIDARRGFEGDPDFATFGERYSKAMDEARTKAVSQISSPRIRKRFEVEDQLFMARGKELVAKQARAGEVDQRRGQIKGSLEALRDGALDDDAAGAEPLAVLTARNQIDTAVAAGYFSAEEGQAEKEKWAESFAVAKIEMLPVSEQIVALQAEGTIADEIDPDVRARMLEVAVKAAETEGVKQLSQAAADEIYEAGLSLKEQLALARDIENPSVRDLTVTRLTRRHAEDKVIAEDERITNLEEVYGIIDTPGSTVDDIPSDLWAQLPAKDRQAVEKYVSPGEIKTEFEIWYDLNTLKQTDPTTFSKVPLVNYRSRLATKDLQAFSDDQNKILEGAPEFDGYQLQTDKQAVDMAAREIGLDPTPGDNRNAAEKMGLWNWRFTQEVNQFKRQNKGREPSAEERRDILGAMSVQAVTNKRWFWANVRERAFEIADIPGVPDEEIDNIVDRLVGAEMPATQTNIQEAWRRMQEDRRQAILDRGRWPSEALRDLAEEIE